jgi:multicomponent Na+:H+ antiporter subunit E
VSRERGQILGRPVTRALRSVAWRGSAFALLWIALTGAATRGWWLGVLVVAAATAASLMMVPPGVYRWSPAKGLRFFIYFIGQSVRGGVDVSRRAMDPRMPIDPGLVRYTLRIRGETARVFMADVVSLLPGTVAAQRQDRELTVHALDQRLDIERILARLEAEVIELFGEES